jgi:hypothetical protein
LDDFDEMLLETIEKVFRYSLGDENAKIVFDYLKKKSCSKEDIPQRLHLFSTELRRLLSSDENRLDRSCQDAPCSASILEETVVRMLCLSLSRARVKLSSIHLDRLRNVDFPQFIILLKEAYLAQKREENMTRPLENGDRFVIRGGEPQICRKENTPF